jgi:MPBQ/MSBQ methyltransferase
MQSEKSIAQLLRYARQLGAADAKDGMSSECIGAHYDNILRSFSKGGFINFGYWYRHTATPLAASENLMEKLIAGIENRAGTILDVGCGNGVTTRYITRYWNPSSVHGINILKYQIAACREFVPDAAFMVMDAASLEFDDQSFDNIISVEATFHFHSRQDFLRHALRVLKDGGTLAISDLLLYETGYQLLPMFPRENRYPLTLVEYRRFLLETGFSQVEIIDITEEGCRSFWRFLFSALHNDWIEGKIEFGVLQRSLLDLYRASAGIKYNLNYSWHKELEGTIS